MIQLSNKNEDETETTGKKWAEIKTFSEHSAHTHAQLGFKPSTRISNYQLKAVAQIVNFDNLKHFIIWN